MQEDSDFSVTFAAAIFIIKIEALRTANFWTITIALI